MVFIFIAIAVVVFLCCQKKENLQIPGFNLDEIVTASCKNTVKYMGNAHNSGALTVAKCVSASKSEMPREDSPKYWIGIAHGLCSANANSYDDLSKCDLIYKQ